VFPNHQLQSQIVSKTKSCYQDQRCPSRTCAEILHTLPIHAFALFLFMGVAFAL
jgi:hypothetical protein